MNNKDIDYKQVFILDGIIDNRRKKQELLTKAEGENNILDLNSEIVKEILSENEMELYKKASNINIEEKWLELQKKGIKFTFFGAPDYPKRLLTIPDPPFALYYRGELPTDDTPAVGIIGARQNSEYGHFMAKKFSHTLAEQGINVISGMALGIDGISQREALFAGGKSYGVLGCGVDIIYPKSNTQLYNELLHKGGVISEYTPGSVPVARCFPPRNRIISGIADCILVVEAREKSGTLITVDMALEQGKEVFVIPGRCTDNLSAGCNKLIRNGATPVCEPEDLLRDMKWLEEDAITKKSNATKKIISENAKIILKILDFQPKSQDEILLELRKRRKSLEMSELMQGLLELELKGLAQRNFGQYSVAVD